MEANDTVMTDTQTSPTIDPGVRIAELERTLEEARLGAARAETRALIHRALASANAVDSDAVALVIEHALPRDAASGPDAAAVSRVLEELRRTRPALFRSATGARTPTMAARLERPRTSLEDAAAHAARTGDRAALLHYLRLKRNS